LKGGIGKKNQLRKKTLKLSKEWGSKLKKNKNSDLMEG